MARMGYEAARSLLRELLSQSTKGNGRLALVEGGLASGKTYLLHEFSLQAVKSGALVLTAICARSEQTLQMGVVDQLFRSAGPTAGLPDCAAQVIGIPDEPGGESGKSQLTPRHTLDTKARELCGLLLDLCARQPVVLAIDDIHFADTASLRLLLSLQRRMVSTRLLIVLSKWHRGKPTLPEFRAELTRHPYSQIRLSPLSVQDIAVLLAGEAGIPEATQSAQGYHKLSGGNPMLLHALVEDNLSTVPAATGELQDAPIAGDAYAHAVLAGLYRWDSELLGVARVAALLGDHSTTALIAQLLGTRLEDTEELVRILADAALLLGERIRHPRGEAAILDSMPHCERSVLHTQVAKLLHQRGAAAMDVARHLLSAEEAPDHWAAPVLRDAAEHALASGDADTAVRCLEFAVGACADNRERKATMYALTRALWRENPAAATLYLPCLQAAVEAGELPMHAAGAVVRYSLWHGEAEAATKAGAALTGTPGLLDEAGTAELSAAFHWYFGSDRTLNTEVANPSPRKGTWADAVNRMTTLWVRGGSDAATTSAQHILRSCHVGETALEVVACAVLALLCGNKPDLARSWCERLIQEAARFGEITWEAVLSGINAGIALRLGDLSTSVHHAEHALELMPPKAWGVLIGQPRATLVAARTCLGDFEAAAEILRQPVPDAMFDTFVGLQYLEARGCCFLATNQALAAGGDFQLCGRLMREWKVDFPALNPWRSNLAQVNLELGHTTEARDLIKQQLDRARATDVRVRGISLRVLAAASELPQRPALLRQSVEHLTAAQDRLELARTLGDFSVVHQQLGEFDRARLLARRAAQVTRACLATAPTTADEGSGAEQRITEQRPPAQPGWRPDGQRTRQVLSEAERRVAELAALGHTNREISQLLYITVSTVEQHLTRVYRKLGITRRTDLLAVYELRGQNPDHPRSSLAGAEDLLPAGGGGIAS
ncbi:AAA family ATPase [Streptomyces sp. NPDC057445]|uniref:AAA family ATPase n=1 Tax=Streptomyces sp. NPDC057445 TaxID=3346136 RepID=UPI0036A7EFC7